MKFLLELIITILACDLVWFWLKPINFYVALATIAAMALTAGIASARHP